MARHNIVYVYGMISGEPTIIKDQETGTFKKGMANIILVRNRRESGYDNGEEALRYDWPMLFSGRADIIEKMAMLHQYDVVEVKGFLTTMDIRKKSTCPCGCKNTVSGTMTFISPIYFDIRRTDSTERESLIDLKEHMEISNQCLLLGNLCNDVKFYRDKKTKTATYQLAVNRKYYLDDGQPNVRTDYPFVINSGDKAEEDAEALHQGSCVYIDGRIQTRRYPRITQCTACGKGYTWYDNTIEVIPYSVEYLTDYLTKEEIEEKKNAELNQLKKDLFT